MSGHKIICGDVIPVLKSLPDEHVDMLMTSVPYWGLRDYGEDTATIWGGDKDCEHNFSEEIKITRHKRESNPGKEAWYKEQDAISNNGGQFCSLCGAWRGQLGLECVSEDTEILTKAGWKSIFELETRMLVATFNIEKEIVEYQPILQIFKEHYKGKTIQIKNLHTNQLLTPNHRVLHKNRRHSGKKLWIDEWHFSIADELQIKNGLILPLSYPFIEGKYTIGEDLAELIGWILTDGGFESGRGYRITIYQSKKVGVERIIYLLNKIGIKHSVIKGNYKSNFTDNPLPRHFIRFSGGWAKKIRLIIPEKKPNNYLLFLKPPELKRLYDGLMWGDGSAYSLYGKYPSFREWFQRLCLHLGKRTLPNESKKSMQSCDRHTTEVSRKNRRRPDDKEYGIREKDYNGLVWCVQTKNKTFIARRNGKIFITGNSTPELYIEHLRMVFAEVKRVLKKTGTCWVNIGDTYASGKSRYNSSPHTLSGKERDEPTSWNKPDLYKEGYDDTCLCLIPELFLIMMVFDLDFILRNKNVWKKDNPMPSSVKNRFNNVWEPVYFFTKNNKPVYFYNDKTGAMVNKKPTSQIEGVDWDWKEVGVVDENSFNVRVRDTGLNRFLVKATEEEKGDYGKPKLKKVSHWHSVDYWFDLDAIREPYTEPLNRWGGNKLKANGKSYWDEGTGQEIYRDRNLRPNKLGKNPGDFWPINTQPFPEAHFAVFPEKLCEKPILAGCPAEVCSVCGMARVRITETEYDVLRKSKIRDQPKIKAQIEQGSNPNLSGFEFAVGKANHETIGWTDCQCGKNLNSCFFCGYKEEHGNLKLKDGIYICDECLLEGRGLENKYEPGIIIDIFAGSGTVGVVAEKHGRSSILIDIKKDYCEMAFKRLKPLVGQTDLSGKQSTIKKEGF